MCSNEFSLKHAVGHTLIHFSYPVHSYWVSLDRAYVWFGEIYELTGENEKKRKTQVMITLYTVMDIVWRRVMDWMWREASGEADRYGQAKGGDWVGRREGRTDGLMTRDVDVCGLDWRLYDLNDRHHHHHHHLSGPGLPPGSEDCWLPGSVVVWSQGVATDTLRGRGGGVGRGGARDKQDVGWLRLAGRPYGKQHNLFYGARIGGGWGRVRRLRERTRKEVVRCRQMSVWRYREGSRMIV